MNRYKLARLVKGRGKGTRQRLRPIDARLGTERLYLTTLRAMLKALAIEVRTGLIPAYRVDRLTHDTDQNTFTNIRALAAMLARTTGQTVERILRLESIRHTETFMDEAKKTLGIDLTAIVRDEDLEEYLRRAVARNTGLIKSLADDMVKQVEQTILANEINGRSVKDLKTALVERMGVADSRAKLISRDQVGKLNSDLNKIRQEQAGIERYEWTTSHDERVRSLHQHLDGIIYKWGQATGAEGGLPPGQPIQCRCIASAIVEF